jgi:peptide/nickel transport system substrate-binding protein
MDVGGQDHRSSIGPSKQGGALILCAILLGCSAATVPPATPTARVTQPPASERTTAAPATEAPATEAPATEAPATEAPATEPGGTEGPATEAPATEPGATESPAQSGEPVSGGTLTMARITDIFTFDPYNTQDDRSIFTELQVYDRLVKLTADGQGVEPELATEWQIADDGLSATFQLREGVLFSDGSPLTVDDVVFSLDRAFDPAGSWGFLFSPVTGAEAVDDETVRIDMSEPFAPLLPALATFAASIYSKSNFESFGETAGEHPLGTGAFALDEWVKGEQLTLTRNPHYWQPGKPYLDQIVFRVIGDDNARVLQLQGGEVDVIDFAPPNQLDLITGSGGKIHRVDGTSTGWLVLNGSKPPLDEANVRCALAWAVDRQAIADTVYFGVATPARSILPSADFYWDPDTDPIGFDLDRAREYLADSSVPGGFELEMTVPTGDSTTLAIAQIWADALAQLGITANIQQIEGTTAQEQFNTGQYTVRISAFTADTPDPDQVMGVTLDYEVQDALHTFYRNEEARQLAIDARKEADPAVRAQMYSELQRVFNRDCSIIYTVEVPRLYASTAQVMGFQPNSQGKYSFENVWKAP